MAFAVVGKKKGLILMYKCNECKSKFYYPEVKRPDAGLVNGKGILGLRVIKPIKFCPECLSVNIEKS